MQEGKRQVQLGPTSLEVLEELGSRVQYDIGEALFFHNDPADCLYILTQGRVELSVTAATGKKLLLDVLHAGELFGEVGVLDGGARTTTATAIEPSVLVQVGRDAVLSVIDRRPRLGMDLMRVLCSRIRSVTRQVEDLALLDIEAQLASRLLSLDERFGDEAGDIRVSQSQLADYLGVSRESVNKTLQSWRAKGCIATARGTVRLLDRAALAAVVSGEP